MRGTFVLTQAFLTYDDVRSLRAGPKIALVLFFSDSCVNGVRGDVTYKSSSTSARPTLPPLAVEPNLRLEPVFAGFFAVKCSCSKPAAYM